MKKVLITIVLAVLVGAAFAFYLFKNIEQSVAKTIDEKEATAFQTGVFSKYDNAVKASKQFKSSIIVQDDNYYRVFIAMFHDEEIINKMKNHFEGTNYYLKKITTTDEFLTKLSKYETLIKTSKINNYDEVNQSILNEYIKSYT